MAITPIDRDAIGSFEVKLNWIDSPKTDIVIPVEQSTTYGYQYKKFKPKHTLSYLFLGPCIANLRDR